MKFASSWRDFDDLQRAARASLFPWRWRVQYSQATVRNVTDSKGYRCPSNSLKLGSFAVINVVVAIAAVFLGRRDVVSGITGGWCGKRDKDSNKRQGCCGKPGSNTWPFMALISVGLNLLANYINALIIHGTPGFSGVSIGGLVLLWCSRPRLAWISTLLVRREKEKSMYFALGASSLMTEVVLQAVGSVYIGTTVNFARQHRYYRIHRLDNILDGNDALIMYGGAMLWMVAIGSALIWAVLAFTSIGRLLKQASKAIWRGISRIWSTIRSIFRWIRCRPRREVQEWPQPHPLDLPPARRPGLRPRPPPYPRRPGTSDSYDTGLDWEDDLEKMGLSVESVERISTVFAFMALPFIGQWLFWAGFLRLSSDL
ncbi:MAG: hypothetical protein M1840_007698 [Geoglossum simile]|nr:MAG: hypothetical protein M1840_007698 [Geoglossum simile]